MRRGSTDSLTSYNSAANQSTMSSTMLRITLLALFVTVVACDQLRQDDDSHQLQETGRTFGHHFLKRLSFAMIPIMYKLGMMTTLLITLTIMSTKGLAVGVLLLVLAISQIIARGYTPVAPVAAPLASPPVYPAVYSALKAEPAVLPVVHKFAAPTVHAVPATVAYSGWHDRMDTRTGYNPYARQDPDSSEYATTD